MENYQLNGIVILYNPTEENIRNILTYVDLLEILYIYDNSKENNELLLSKFLNKNNVIYLHNGDNDGISKSINNVINLIKVKQYSWLLTMDQDSSFTSSMFKDFIREVDFFKHNTAIYSPIHLTKKSYKATTKLQRSVLMTMTSGNLLNVNICINIGLFDERYFIDSVDHEYCLRANMFGFNVIEVPSIKLQHGLGEPITCLSIFSRKEIIVFNHNYMRRYYITRNKLLLISEYYRFQPKVSFIFLLEIFWDLKNIVFYETDKRKKLISNLLGLFDFFKKKFGKKTFKLIK